MIDLYNLEIEIGYGANGEQIEISRGEVLELIARLRQAEKDAARYRWLRDTGCFEGSTDDLFHATPAETDAEFDRFMQCNK